MNNPNTNMGSPSGRVKPRTVVSVRYHCKDLTKHNCLLQN